ncbi:MAG: trehalose-phosphatase [Solirubrobacterales bacterium]
MSPDSTSLDALLAPLCQDPAGAAVLTDVDGTIAPIVGDPAAASVPDEARAALAAIAACFAVVACVSGRAAADAKRLVGLDELTYIGNHGLERLEPGSTEARSLTALAGHERAAADFVSRLDAERIAAAGLRTEDKGPISALHWRGAANEDAAEAIAAEIGADAGRAGLRTHLGRKVLELRPPVDFDKGIAIAEMLRGGAVRSALYAGDDHTDLDGFRVLRELVASGELEAAVCVGIASSESPAAVTESADIVLPGPPAFVAVLEALAAS